MKEIIFLSFGNNSNYVFSHFLNLNDELLKNKLNPLNLIHYSIFNDAYHPRSLIFDYSPNIQKYYILNEKIEQDEINTLKSKYEDKNNNTKLEIFQNDLPQNNFLSMMNELNLIDTNIDDEDDNNDEEEEEDEYNNNINIINYNKKKQRQKNKEKNENTKPKKEMSEKLEGLLNLNDNELYEYFNFNKSIKNWNDYLQIKLPMNCLQEIKSIDVG
jgi:hypothetical protein